MGRQDLARVVTTVGLAFDLVGGVLLGVEAVKLENLRRLRRSLGRRGAEALRMLNPEIVFVDDDASASGRGCYVYLFTYLAAGALVLVGLYLILTPSVLPPLAKWLPSVPLLLRVPVLLVLGAVIAMTLSTTIIGSVLPWIGRLTIAALTAIDDHTPTGGIGMLGMCLFGCGFVAQIAAVWIAPGS